MEHAYIKYTYTKKIYSYLISKMFDIVSKKSKRLTVDKCSNLLLVQKMS